MRHSIKFKMIGITTVLLLSSILICWGVNKWFLEEYYRNYKVKNSGEVEEQVEELLDKYQTYNEDYDRYYCNSKEAEEKFNTEMGQLEANNGVSIYILNYSLPNLGPSLYWPNYNTAQANRVIMSALRFFSYVSDPQWNVHMKEGKMDDPKKGDKPEKRFERLKDTDTYTIAKVFDMANQTYYIDLMGNLKGNNFIYIRTNFEGVRESARISNQFLGYVGFFIILVGSIVMYFVSRKFTRPIYELSNIAHRMSMLDFSVKYEDTSKDEIGALGNSINVLSNQLEVTISDLKRANNELQRDIKNKIEIDEMRKEFLSNVTHELKTPIALIQGYAEGLKDNISEDQESREFYCEVIIDEANKMNTMVKKLLTLNQIESSNNMIEFDHFDIVEVVRSVVNSYAILAEERGVTIQFEEQPPLYVWADEYMIEEVITNYISNAFNHVKEPNQIEIRIERRGEEARVSVFNTGNPIPEQDLPHIWTKFYKVDKARTREYGGSGIGLSIVKAIMNAHNKSCGGYNRENGVEFWFDIDTKN